jgi:hypothetical protein
MKRNVAGKDERLKRRESHNGSLRKSLVNVLIYCFCAFIFISGGALLPREIKGPFPYAWGYLEGRFNRDLTGWWFSSYQGEGTCRIKNGREAFSCPGSRIIFGTVYPPNDKPYPHQWATNSHEQIIDDVCPVSNPSCQQRRAFAVIDAATVTIMSQTTVSKMEENQVKWGVQYLAGFKKGMK